jgi:hypothetical protein
MTSRFVVAAIALGLLGACTSGAVTVPRDTVLYEVPRPATPFAGSPAAAAPAPTEDFASRIGRAIDGGAPGGGRGGGGAGEGGVGGTTTSAPDWSPPPPPAAAQGQPRTTTSTAQASPLDDDRLNLNEYTLEQQRIDAAIAERELEAARRQLVVVQPEATVPQAAPGVNIALYAQQTTHRVGERRFQRPALAFASRGACRRFASADDAQRFFLANGGPARDPHGLDPDGDGFACGWDPEPFRRLAR